MDLTIGNSLEDLRIVSFNSDDTENSAQNTACKLENQLIHGI